MHKAGMCQIVWVQGYAEKEEGSNLSTLDVTIIMAAPGRLRQAGEVRLRRDT